MQLGDLSFFRTSSGLAGKHNTRKTMILSVTILLFAAWVTWFFQAPLTLTQTSESAVLQTDHRLSATFSPRITPNLYPGQPVQIIFDDFPESVYGSNPGYVNKIEPSFREGRLVVEIVIEPQPGRFPLQRGLTGHVNVVTATQTPAELLWLTVKKTIGRQ